jgi:hypothetical protein
LDQSALMIGAVCAQVLDEFLAQPPTSIVPAITATAAAARHVNATPCCLKALCARGKPIRQLHGRASVRSWF